MHVHSECALLLQVRNLNIKKAQFCFKVATLFFMLSELLQSCVMCLYLQMFIAHKLKFTQHLSLIIQGDVSCFQFTCEELSR